LHNFEKKWKKLKKIKIDSVARHHFYDLECASSFSEEKFFFGNGFFWITAFFGKGHFLDPKKALSKKSPFQKKPFPKKYGHPSLYELGKLEMLVVLGWVGF